MTETEKNKVIDFLYEFYAPNGCDKFKFKETTKKHIENKKHGTEYKNCIYLLSTLINDADGDGDYLISQSLEKVFVAFYKEIPEFFPNALQGILRREYDT